MNSFSLSAMSPAWALRGLTSSQPNAGLAAYQHVAARPGSVRLNFSSSTVIVPGFFVSKRYATPSGRATSRTPQSPKSANVSCPARLTDAFL